MQFRQCVPSAVAAVVFAHCSIAAPFSGPGNGSHTSTPTGSLSTTATGIPSATSTLSPLLKELSKTQQILLSDTRVDVYNNVLTEDEDFIFDFGARRSKSGTGAADIVAANRKTFPALTNQGIAMAVGFMEPCQFNLPHVHNRATELLIVTQGKLVSEMVIENGVEEDGVIRNIRNELGPYQMTPFFQGSIHSQYNPGCEEVIFVAPQSSEDFGTNQVAKNLFGLDNEILRAAFGNSIDGAEVDKFRGLVSDSVARGVEQCLLDCNIPKRK
ncbi:hypothetical protein DL771_002196 [Monosporascus sp. 5C6A]|nr:hypothetical protein DL771_002196 [Monosporascus sp. 5C6A]